MTAIARLTSAELRKLATTPAFLITLAVAVVIDVLSVVVDAAVAGRTARRRSAPRPAPTRC
jgi:hypothetical protein